ncbi:MAG: class II glutamine amidotransferase [Lachnospiraceae bacterium]|nr:class II glutamine amidotransferase [Lachnospiraceae bacterium]
MCELFGISAKRPIKTNEYLSEFFGRSKQHPDGWGLAVFRGHSVSLEKEPIMASKSAYLRGRLLYDIEAGNLIAHIRLATIGDMNYSNCHPFVWDDESGRSWTLVHNGTIFENDIISPYFVNQEGSTDSEGVLLYIVDNINQKIRKKKAELSSAERFDVIDKCVLKLSACGKLNLILFDGETMYVHTNYKDSLYFQKSDEAYAFVTRPLSVGKWENLPMQRLFGYNDGVLAFEGSKHNHEYFDDNHDMSLIYLAYSQL